MRKWIKTMSPRQVNSFLNCYNGEWMKHMDRCWESDDGYCVTSRLLMTKFGKVEHVSIIKQDKEKLLSTDGARDISWKVKQEIKNELFGENRLAIEVFPKTDRLVDTCDVYHLWVFEKSFELPFGIHPKEFNKSQYINRGFNFSEADYNEYMKFKNIGEENE